MSFLKKSMLDGITMGEEGKITTKLTSSEIREFEALLLAKRNEILGNVISLEDETLRKQRSDLSSMPIHMADLGTDSYEQEFTLELMDSERKVITEIDYALNRIEEGTYGICEIGGELIPKQRLEAIPWARLCVGCAGLIEKGVVKREDLFNKYDYASGIDDEVD
ncbi:MAG: TraR/DksA family transcriptional regulator [Planctomycetota bacterium]|jgi:DnaK suppressor protein